jgi:hypothetical protein
MLGESVTAIGVNVGLARIVGAAVGVPMVGVGVWVGARVGVGEKMGTNVACAWTTVGVGCGMCVAVAGAVG